MMLHGADSCLLRRESVGLGIRISLLRLLPAAGLSNPVRVGHIQRAHDSGFAIEAINIL